MAKLHTLFLMLILLLSNPIIAMYCYEVGLSRAGKTAEQIARERGHEKIADLIASPFIKSARKR